MRTTAAAEDSPWACAPVLTAVRTLAVTRGGIEARLIEAARVVVAACGDELLTVKGFTSVQELTPAQRKKWRAEGKAAAVDELIATLGLSQAEARDLVGISLAGGQIPQLVIRALERGWVTWSQVRAFWRRCYAMPLAEAELVAMILFGAEVDLAHPDRLDPDGHLAGLPWEHHAYRAALAAEATRVDGKDPAAERGRREAAYLARHMSVTINEDGTATLALTGDLIAVCAAFTRIDNISRLLRKRGDTRTLPQLCFDVAVALLVHGHIPALDKHPDDLTEDDLHELARIITAQPTIDLQVIVPFDTLTGSPACPSCGHGYAGQSSEDSRGSEDGHEDADAPEPSWPPPGWAPPREGGLAELTGHHPAYLSPGLARELALRQGTTITRLLTDVRDGRLLERTRTGYRPDADMRAQVIAADRYCRGPLGTRRPAETCELDHVLPYHADDDGSSTGGATSPTNLAALAMHPHHRKTRDELRVTINERRDLTWTTLLAGTISTRSHDYRQYCSGIRAELDHEHASDEDIERSYRRSDAGTYREAADQLIRKHHGQPPSACYTGPTPAADLSDEDRRLMRDIAARALYAALVHRGPESMLADSDDFPGATEHGGPLAGWMFVTHQHPRTGTRQPGPASDHPTPEQVLDLPPHPADQERQATGPRDAGAGQQPREQHGAGESGEHPRTGQPWQRRDPHQPPPF